MNRRSFVAASLASAGLSACGPQKAQLTDALRGTLNGAQALNQAVIGTRGMAKLYTEADITWNYPVNSLETPSDARYAKAMADGSREYRCAVSGLVEHPLQLSLADIAARPQLTEITRHDCVEGWSVIGKWRGVQLAGVLDDARPQPNARYVMFRCFDQDEEGNEYYESLDLHQARHPQTLLCTQLNDKPIDPMYGGPLRLRVPTQLGYKSAKWVRSIELVAAFPKDSHGGYWEDNANYQWYAGI